MSQSVEYQLGAISAQLKAVENFIRQSTQTATDQRDRTENLVSGLNVRFEEIQAQINGIASTVELVQTNHETRLLRLEDVRMGQNGKSHGGSQTVNIGSGNREIVRSDQSGAAKIPRWKSTLLFMAGLVGGGGAGLASVSPSPEAGMKAVTWLETLASIWKAAKGG